MKTSIFWEIIENMKNELISIIVPIYNVEKFLNKCIESIIGQTYKNIEIILVDDGSKDGSGLICDEYAKKDRRIKVVHQPNGGVSSARNTGLREATGEYIGFVDPDDYISENMYTLLYNRLTETSADISMCGYKCYFDKQVEFTANGDVKEYTNIEVIEKLIFDDIFTSHLWNKLYRKELFARVEFPIDRIYEDVSVIYKIFDNAKKIIYDNSIQYAYYQRPESLCNSISYKKMGNYVQAIEERYEYLLNKYNERKELLYASRVYSSMIFNYIVAKDKNIELYNSDILVNDYKNNIEFKLKFIGKIKTKYLIALLILKLNRKLFYKFFSK